jgi:hypothetical protein
MTNTTPRSPVPLLAAALLLLAQGCAAGHAGAAAQVTPARTMDQILAASPAADWRPLDPSLTVQLELATGRVVIELAPAFAPEHVANLRALARGGCFDGLAVVRVQDGSVAQWGDPLAGQPGARPLGGARPALAGPLLRRGGGGARRRPRLRQRRRALRRHRPPAAPARPERHGGRPGGGRHGAALGPAARRRAGLALSLWRGPARPA